MTGRGLKRRGGIERSSLNVSNKMVPNNGLAAVRFARQEIGWFKSRLALATADALNR